MQGSFCRSFCPSVALVRSLSDQSKLLITLLLNNRSAGKWSVVKASLCHLVCLSGCDANDSPDLNAEIGARCNRNSLVEQASMILFESGHSYVVERKLVFRKTLLLCSAIVAISFQL